MPTDRCARLTLVSVANDVKEAWISDHPYLAVCYLWQYAPTWAWWLMNRMGKKRIQNFKSGIVSVSLSLLPACFALLMFASAVGMVGLHRSSLTLLSPDGQGSVPAGLPARCFYSFGTKKVPQEQKYNSKGGTCILKLCAFTL